VSAADVIAVSDKRRAVANDGTFMSYATACQKYDLSHRKLRELVRRYRLTRYRPIFADRRCYLRRDDLDALPEFATDPVDSGRRHRVAGEDQHG
jgi:hypothetical protein